MPLHDVPEVMCPHCAKLFSTVGDHGVCIDTFGGCLICTFRNPASPKYIRAADIHGFIDHPDVQLIAHLREKRERALNRRAFPCPKCAPSHDTDCALCHRKGYIIGIPAF